MSSNVWLQGTSVDCVCSSLFSCFSSIVVDANDSLSTGAEKGVQLRTHRRRRQERQRHSMKTSEDKKKKNKKRECMVMMMMMMMMMMMIHEMRVV